MLVLLVCAVVLLIIAIAVPRTLTLPTTGEDFQVGTAKKWVAIIALTLIVVSIIGASYRQVPAGFRGVRLQFGAVAGVMPEGPNFLIPFVQDDELIEVRTQKTVAAKAAAASQDLQTVKTDVAINYHIDPRSVGILYKSVGPDFADRIIDPKVQEALKAVVARYTAEQLIRNRDAVKSELDATLSSRLAAYNIIVESNGVSLTNFDFSAEFNGAIEQKQVAQQTAEQQKYVLAKAQTEAQTAITKAKGEAEANRLKAQALNSLGGGKVLAREWIEKWDGHLPTVSGGSQAQLIDIKDLMASSADKKAQ